MATITTVLKSCSECLETDQLRLVRDIIREEGRNAFKSEIR